MPFTQQCTSQFDFVGRCTNRWSMLAENKNRGPIAAFIQSNSLMTKKDFFFIF